MDRYRCGECCEGCPTGETCVSPEPGGAQTKKCLPSCDGGVACVGDAGALDCIDPYTDPSNCGACGNVCAANAVCHRGQCLARCDGGLVCDYGSTSKHCVDLDSDPSNCGNCSAGCGSPTTKCFDGGCVLPDAGP